jgi:hypothetical protein
MGKTESEIQNGGYTLVTLFAMTKWRQQYYEKRSLKAERSRWLTKHEKIRMVREKEQR